jgi:glyoxylase-like metal-dependent hydrolase (beta-lactamase superfamily II)
VGRTDLPGGSFDTLQQSIKTKMYMLPEDVIVYPGHGESTTIGDEMKTNPFVKLE